jgi:hypothetical protein
MYVNNVKQGHGILQMVDGTEFKGTWRDGLLDGHGTYIEPTGAEKFGMWNQGKFE